MGFSQKGNIARNAYSSPAYNTHTPEKVDDDDEPSGVEMYTPSPRQAQSGQGWFFFQSKKIFDKKKLKILQTLIVHQQSDDSDEDEDESADETGDEDMEALMPKYDPKEFENLDVK